MSGQSDALPAGARADTPARGRSSGWLVMPALFALAAALPWLANDYWTVIGTRAAIYWVLVAGLNLVVGFGGQLAIGYVALLTLGAYTASILAAGTVTPAVPPLLALVAAGGVGAVAGAFVGLPALRLRTFYFAMTTLGFATIVTQVALAWQSVTGGGIGVVGPAMPAPLDGARGFFLFCLAIAAALTAMTANVARGRFGRALVAVRDADVMAEAVGVNKSALLLTVFLFSGACAGVAGGLFASLQSYITPDAFTFDLSVLFFIAILIGGRGSIIGPLLGTVLLTLLPEFAAPLVAWSTFLYAALLLAIVLLAPGGIAEMLDFSSRRPLAAARTIVPRPTLVLPHPAEDTDAITLNGVVLAFGGVRAVDGLDFCLNRGEIHGLIGPNGSGKTTTLNIISGYYPPSAGNARLCSVTLSDEPARSRARCGIARTFQTPRLVGAASVLDNVMLGAAATQHASFVGNLFRLPAARREEHAVRAAARRALSIVGLDALADARCDRLRHAELRFVEIARALVAHPRFLLLDEPAAGLSADEIARLGELLRVVARAGTGVLLVEHHADLIFDICDRVTVLNLGRVLAAGTPADIRAHPEVVEAYLGG